MTRNKKGGKKTLTNKHRDSRIKKDGGEIRDLSTAVVFRVWNPSSSLCLFSVAVKWNSLGFRQSAFRPYTQRRAYYLQQKKSLLSSVWFSRSTPACKIISWIRGDRKDLGTLEGKVLTFTRPVLWFSVLWKHFFILFLFFRNGTIYQFKYILNPQ